MVFRLCPEVFEDGLLPVPLHMIPVVYHPVANRIVHAIARGLGIRERLVADEKVEVLDTALGREMTRLGWDCGRVRRL
jgi:hypothetical protein